MNVSMLLFLLVGAVFGVVTWPRRHLFSEGPSQRQQDPTDQGLRARLSWILQCAALWPLLAATGLHSSWLLAQRKKAEAARLKDSSGR